MSKRILLVDDDPVIRALLKDYLSALDYEVEVAESGIQCLEKLTRGLPDALLLDFQMPVMTGLEVLKSIRKSSAMKNLRVIMLSANKDTQRVIEEERVKADGYILKPFEMREVVAAISQAA